MSDALRARARGRLRAVVLGPLAPYIRRVLKSLLLSNYLVYGDSGRLTIADTAVVANTLFNTVSGAIRVEPYALFGHNVCLLTGTHDYRRFGHARQQAELDAGRDIVIGEGAWLASNVTVLGPCTIGPHAVVAAGAVVRADVAPYAVVAGVPAREVSTVEPGSGSDVSDS